MVEGMCCSNEKVAVPAGENLKNIIGESLELSVKLISMAREIRAEIYGTKDEEKADMPICCMEDALNVTRANMIEAAKTLEDIIVRM